MNKSYKNTQMGFKVFISILLGLLGVLTFFPFYG